VDFSYEVSRSLAAVEGAILLVDATKGVQAQTLANLHLARQQNLKIIPAINKIDLPGARIAEVEEQVKNILGDPSVHGAVHGAEILKISAKEGTGVEKLLQAIIAQVPPPRNDKEKPLRALVFDSNYDSYKGVLAYVRMMDGEIKRGQKIILMASGARSEVVEVGIFKPNLVAAQNLSAGEIGYIATGLKEVALCRVGDTITIVSAGEAVEPLLGYAEPKPMIFASFYPAQGQDFDLLKDALAQLRLSDSSLFFEPESSEALGRGFRCGFLGMLHLEIVTERLKREHQIELIVTTPSVVNRLKEKHADDIRTIYSPQELPDASRIELIEEPWIKLEILSPNQYLGTTIKLLEKLSGIYQDTKYLTGDRIVISYEVPLREIIVDFYDKLKSATAGYASMSYDFIGWRPGDLVCLDILVAGEKVEALSRLVPRVKARYEGQAIVEKLKEVLPAQLFAVALQAAVGGKILAREDLRARRKDVTGYLYGGDVSRKKKLLEKQKKGKKKMKERGRVDIPQEVFLKVLRK
jgi:GTP-binding protein LepA